MVLIATHISILQWFQQLERDTIKLIRIYKDNNEWKGITTDGLKNDLQINMPKVQLFLNVDGHFFLTHKSINLETQKPKNPTYTKFELYF